MNFGAKTHLYSQSMQCILFMTKCNRTDTSFPCTYFENFGHSKTQRPKTLLFLELPSTGLIPDGSKEFRILCRELAFLWLPEA